MLERLPSLGLGSNLGHHELPLWVWPPRITHSSKQKQASLWSEALLLTRFWCSMLSHYWRKSNKPDSSTMTVKMSYKKIRAISANMVGLLGGNGVGSELRTPSYWTWIITVPCTWHTVTHSMTWWLIHEYHVSSSHWWLLTNCDSLIWMNENVLLQISSIELWRNFGCTNDDLLNLYVNNIILAPFSIYRCENETLQRLLSAAHQMSHLSVVTKKLRYYNIYVHIFCGYFQFLQWRPQFKEGGTAFRGVNKNLLRSSI